MPDPTEIESRGGLTCMELVRAPWFRCRELQLARGEIAVLHGPTGAGKTLFLRTLADLDPADAGEVRLDGRTRTSTPPEQWRRSVLYVHPGGARTPGTVAENLRRIEELSHNRGLRLDAGELPLERDASELSTGQGQLLALQRALGLEPEALLLDEATTGLDAAHARAAEERIAGFARAGGVVLWVSHDSQLAERLGARRLEWNEVMLQP